MTQQLIIEGDLVRVLETSVVTEARLQDLLPHIESRPPITVGLLPKSAIVFFWDESDAKHKRAAFLCEVTPGVRTADYNNRKYPISLPWTYFLFDFETAGNPVDGHTLWTHTNSRIFWAREQVTSMDSMLATALVPNCDTAGGICYGSTAVDANLPLGVRVDRLVDEFYRTTFTHDSGTGSPWQSETGSSNWDRWVKETTKDPNAWRNFPEWDEKKGRIKFQPLSKVLNSRHNRFEPIQLTGTIPELIEPMTFGRAEEWVATLSDENVMRLAIAINNRNADKKDGIIVEGVTTAETPTTTEPEAPAPTTRTPRIRQTTRITPIEN